MRRLPLLFVLLLLVTGSSFAADHYILSPARLLNEQEQADLASRGLIIERPLANGRYLVRFAAGATVADDDPRIAALTPLTAGRKLHRTALREAVSGRAYARLNVLFHEDVSFESARAAILASGGTLTEGLQTDFHEPRRISARIASGDVAKLAADERVMLVYGPMRLQIAPENAQSALLSNVTPVQTAPYDLTGQGVTLSLFELGIADASHREFGGRLTTHITGGSTSDQQHATHVSGTMIAAGVDPAAKGMAPNAMLHELSANDDNFLDLKAGLVSTYSVVADNNSWGFVIGWCGPPSCTDWVWTDTDLFYGAYDSFVSAPLDTITRTSGVLMVHSAGNDADKLGPQFAPFAHSHRDANNKDVTGYCYSANGSGTDCIAPCKNTPDFCEVTRHPQLTSQLPAPWLSIGLTASAKNVIAVGAVDSAKQIASFSSRGPTRDGRVKPDLVTRGVGVYSTFPNNMYSSLPGTSMSSPVVTGSSALLVEQWRRTFGGANPTPAVLKTLMLGTAQDLGNRGPDYTFGFGLLDVKAAVDTIVADGGQSRRIKVGTMATGGKMELPLNMTSNQTLRVTLGWSDPEVLTFPVDSGDPTDPLAAKTLVNDLDLKVVDPNGNDILPYVLDPANPDLPATRGVNHIDNTEQVEIAATPGSYRVVVTGTAVTASSPQTFVVVANAELGAAVIPCTDVNEPNGTEQTAYGFIVSNQTVSGTTCRQDDIDFFKFLVDRPGAVTVTVTTTDTPLRMTLFSASTPTVTVDLPAGSIRTIGTPFTGNVATTFFVRVEATGTIGLGASYTITPTFPYASHGRRRSVRRAH